MTKSSKTQPPKPPNPNPPKVTMKILGQPPSIIDRPLKLIKGQAYAAAWIYFEYTKTDYVTDSSGITRAKTKVTNEFQRVIVRNDGKFFPVDEELEKLGIQINLSMTPPPSKTWSGDGVAAYLAGHRPQPAEIFQQLVEVIDHHIDFVRSLADQKTMCEMNACYILTTWFLDAFNVIGYLWANGERGSGKTQLIALISELAYLGQLILAGGSYPSLRDEADYGATLCFDDAENISDIRRADPDKRALILAGNRRGSIVTVKEPKKDRGWANRHVSTFCPRAFSAIRLPDATLSSRAIPVPLIRTANRSKANSDPADYELWPHNRDQLKDDLWSMALANLADLTRYEREVNNRARLTGRNLEPWKAILAVALWLEDNGVPGIWERMEELSWRFHNEERNALQQPDLTHLVIRSLLACAISASKADSANTNEWFFYTSDIAKIAQKIAKDDEIDIDLSVLTSRRVGRILGAMRFENKRPDGQKPRGWVVKMADLERWCLSYGIPFPSDLDTSQGPSSPVDEGHSSNGTNGITGINGTMHQLTLDDAVNFSKHPDTSKPCFACGQLAWIERPNSQGGGWFCGLCHPVREEVSK